MRLVCADSVTIPAVPSSNIRTPNRFNQTSNGQHILCGYEQGVSVCPGRGDRRGAAIGGGADADAALRSHSLERAGSGGRIGLVREAFRRKRITEAPDRLMFGSTRFHVPAKRHREAERRQRHRSRRVLVCRPRREDEGVRGRRHQDHHAAARRPGPLQARFLEDPWGTRIEVVQDPELLGLHHIHMRGPNPEEVLTWLLDKFGGKRQQLKGRIDAVRYDHDGFSSMWILVTKGEAEPSIGHAIDHIGWRSTGPLADTINALRAKKVEVTAEPRPLKLPGGPPINFSYVAGHTALESSW